MKGKENALPERSEGRISAGFFRRPGLVPLVLFFAFFSPLRGFAHPHVFIDARVTFVTDQKGLKGIRMNWVFDSFFSESIHLDYDSNKDKSVSPAERKNMIRTIRENLKKFSFFSHLYTGNRYYAVPDVRQFNIRFGKDGKASFSFFIPFRLPFTARKIRVALAVFDESFYSAFSYSRRKPVSVEQEGEGRSVKAFLQKNKKAFLGPLPTEGWIEDAPFLFVAELGGGKA